MAADWKNLAPPDGRYEAAGWPPESYEAERRFGSPHARLFPLIGEVVMTPRGPGWLWQAFADRVGVVLFSAPGRVLFTKKIEKIQPARLAEGPALSLEVAA